MCNLINLRMKKFVSRFFVLSLLLVTVSCVESNNKQKEQEEKTADVEVNTPQDIHSVLEAVGSIGDGTSMDVLELVKENGDTLDIVTTDAKVFGGLECGQKVDVFYNNFEDESGASMIINLSVLQNTWVLDGNPNAGFTIVEDGVVDTYNMKDRNYNHWKIDMGALLMSSDYSGTLKVDTFHLQTLSDDSLVISGGNSVLKMVRR